MSQARLIKAVIFDWGGVLCEDTARGLVTYFSRALDVDPQRLVKAFRPFLPAFQKGELSETELWRGLAASLGLDRQLTRPLWGEALRAIYSPREEMFVLAAQLKAKGYRIGLLSNAEMAAMEFFYEQSYQMFDEAIFSCAVGARKPEHRIYEVALERLRVLPTEAVFIDDRVDFIEGARKLGIHTILYRDPAQVRRELATLAIVLA